MKLIFSISVFCLTTACCIAQQVPQYNQYIFNELVINPAYAGTKEITNADAFFSKQWVGVDGSPATETVSMDGPLSEKMGLGLQIINDNIGAESQQSLFGSYSYKLRINEKYKLSLGLALGVTDFSINGNELTTATPDDPSIPRTYESKVLLDAKTGLFFYSDRFYAGLSVTDLLANAFKSNPFYIQQVRNYYVTSGYVFDVLPKLRIKPSFLLKHAYGSPSNIDLNAFFLYDQRFWLGFTYRFGSKLFVNNELSSSLENSDAFIIMLEYNVNEKFRIGYAYTMMTSVFQGYTSHEISLGYFIPGKVPVKKMNNIRYF